MDLIDFGIWASGAVMVVGVMQWLKGLFKNANTVLWAILLPIIAIAVSILASVKTGNYNSIPWNAVGIWSVSQVGYEIIIQTIKNKLA